MAEHITRLVITSVQIVGRAFVRAVKQEISASRDAAKRRHGFADDARVASAWSVKGLSLREAMEILNIDRLDPEIVKKNYQHLMSMNETAKGSTLYLQSKIVRAKERIDVELVRRREQ